MTELEQRLINDLSKLAEQYEREQTQLSAQVQGLSDQVKSLADQVKSLAAQQASDLNGYIEYSSRTTEHLDSFSEYANVLAEKYNEMIRLMEERWL